METFLDLSNIDTHLLIQELDKRGYKTDLLFSKHDVEYELEFINLEREDDEQIELTEEDKLDILDRINYEYSEQRIKEDIYDLINNYYIDNL